MMPQRYFLSLNRNGTRPRVLQAVALTFLLLGLVLLDRGFVSWRNDPRTQRDVAGDFPSGLDLAKVKQRRWLMFSGTGLLLMSVLLFTREPV